MTNEQSVSLRVDDGIAIVCIDNPPINALSQHVRQGLLDAIERVDDDPQITAAVLRCAGRTFIAGADIKEFDNSALEPQLPDLIARHEKSRKPWVAAIHGTALGGGLEVTLGCHYRIADRDAKMGLPEVNLGLIPGAGGTVRLPRLINAEHALTMVSGGKPVSATQAHEWGLLDQLSDSDKLFDSALALAQEVSQKSLPTPLSQRDSKAFSNESNAESLLAAIEKKARGQISPVVAANAIVNAIDKTASEALEDEREQFLQLKQSEQSAALRYIFFAERSATKPGDRFSTPPRSINTAGVIGGGTMGAGIATALLLAGIPVTMVERDDSAVERGVQTVKAHLGNSLQRGLISESRHDTLVAQLAGSVDYGSLSSVDFIIEAVFEEMPVKRDVFKQLEAATKPEAILASNTSYLDVNQIAATVNNPSRVVGLHFFSPAHVMKLLEIVRTESVATDVITSSFALAKRLRKLPVLAGVCDGFIGNRIMSAYRRECDYMLEDGALPHEIDRAMVDFGFPMGVFAMQDLAGLDIAWAMRKRQATTRDPNQRYVAIADRLCELERFGRKSGRGWYSYNDKKQSKTIDDEVLQIILDESARNGIERQPISNTEICVRILGSMQREAVAVLKEGIADSPEAIDVVMVNGYGFPRWRGGPMYLQKVDAAAT